MWVKLGLQLNTEKGYTVQMTSYDDSCYQEQEVLLFGTTKSKICKSVINQYLTYNFNSTYEISNEYWAIAKCERTNYNEWIWNTYMDTIDNLSRIYMIKINMLFFAEVNNPYGARNNTFFEQQFPRQGIQEIFYSLDFKFHDYADPNDSDNFWDNYIGPTIINEEFAYQLYGIQSSLFCSQNCLYCNNVYYSENDDEKIGAECLICHPNYQLSKSGECICIRYSFQNNYIGWGLKQLALSANSFDAEHGADTYTVYESCYSVDKMIQNNCGYCFRAWRDIISDSQTILNVEKIVMNTPNDKGENGVTLTVKLLGAQLPAEIADGCKNQLKLWIGQFLLSERSYINLSPMIIWQNDTEDYINSVTYEFVFWLDASTAAFMSSVDWNNNVLVLYYKISLGISIYDHNTVGCGWTPDNALNSPYQYCYSFIRGICQCFPFMDQVTQYFQKCDTLKTDNSVLYCIEQIRNPVTNYLECNLCIRGYKLVISDNYRTKFCKTIFDPCELKSCYMCGCEGNCDQYCFSITLGNANICKEKCLVCAENYWPDSTLDACVQNQADTTNKIANCKYHRATTQECYQCDTLYVVSSVDGTCVEINLRPRELVRMTYCRIFNDTSNNACLECQAGYEQMDIIGNAYCQQGSEYTNFELASKFLIAAAIFRDEDINFENERISYNVQTIIESTPSFIICPSCQIDVESNMMTNKATFQRLCADKDCLQQLSSFRIGANDTIYVQYAPLNIQNIYNWSSPITTTCGYILSDSLTMDFGESQCATTPAIHGNNVDGYLSAINITEIMKIQGIANTLKFKLEIIFDDETLNQSFGFIQVVQNNFVPWTIEDWWNFYGGIVFILNIAVPMVTSIILIVICGMTVKNIKDKMIGKK